jgi:hypothetical protein
MAPGDGDGGGAPSCDGGAVVTAATRSRLRAAVRALRSDQRARHLHASAALLHLLDHCVEGREPIAFVAGRRAYQRSELRWAVGVLERPSLLCPGADCTEPDHVTLTKVPVEVRARVG